MESTKPKTKSFEIFYCDDGVSRKTAVVYKSLSAARNNAKIILRKPNVSAVSIVGYDGTAHRSFWELLK